MKFKRGDWVEFVMSKTFSKPRFGTFLHMIFKKGKALAQIRLENSNVVTVDPSLVLTDPSVARLHELKESKGW